MNSEIFYVGQAISSLNELQKLQGKYEEQHFCELWNGDVCSLDAVANRVPRRVEIVKPSLKY